MVRSYLDPTCVPEDWSEIPPGEQLIYELNASVDPNYFWENPKMGNFELYESKKEIFKEFYKYDKDGKRIKSELLFFAGMKSGKTRMAALIALTESYKLLMMKNPQEHYKLAPGTEIMCVNVAKAEHQALDTVFKQAKEMVANSPYFASQKLDLVYNALKFTKKNITVKALGSDLGSGLGRSLKVFVADEIDSYDDPESIYTKLSNQTILFKPWNENIRVAITSRGENSFTPNQQEKAKKYEWKWVLSVSKPTWELNPNMTLKAMEEERKRDPDAFDRDFSVDPIQDRERLFNEVKLKQAEDRCREISNLFLGSPSIHSRSGFVPDLDYSLLKVADDATDYYVSVDPSIKHDAFGLSVGYLSINQETKIIGSTIFKSAKNEEINTLDISEILKPVFEALPIRYYIYDVHLHSELRELSAKYGISPYFHQLVLNDWIFTRNDLYTSILSVPHSDYLFKEFKELLIIRNKKVDHPSSGSKDQADTVAQIDSFIRAQQEEAKLKSNEVVTHYIGRF